MSSRSIGIFDSGIGGLSIWKEITALLPHENTIYLADSKNAPYGQRSAQEIIDLSVKNAELLLKKDCKAIVVACNTATTNAISLLRSAYDIPIIGIEPAIKPAALQTKTNAIGILATKGTLSSALFSETSGKFTEGITVVEQIGEGLVPLIESGRIESPEMEILLKKYLTPMLETSIDYLVLGCSHYPFLITKIREMVGESVKIIDSGEAVARQTKAVLEKYHSLNTGDAKPRHTLYTNADITTLKMVLEDSSLQYTLSQLNF